MDIKTIKNKIIDAAVKHGDKVEFNYPLADHTSIGVGGNALVFCIPSSVESLRDIRQKFFEMGMDFIIIGNGTNMLIPDEGINDLVINLTSDSFTRIDMQGELVSAGGGARLTVLINTCIKNGLGGLEGLAGIPASVGGAVCMNASYKAAIESVFVKAKVLKENNEIVEISKDEVCFDYRKSSFDEKDIILEAVFRLRSEVPGILNERYLTFLEDKKSHQPLGEKTLGCIFKNPTGSELGAGEIIDISGMKGVREGGATVSRKHANFIVNEGNARSGEILALMEKMKASVRKRFSIELEPEIKIL